ncbi:MAG: hypothetical protein IJT73_08555 [Selenomonadaceae bacterium]|nr:hypothetical protein [Selenomonadaceae bacterium]
MMNAKEYKPIVEELIDLMNRQKKLSIELLGKVRMADKDEEFLWAIREHLEKIDEQAEALEKIARMTQVSFEDEEFKRIVKNDC